MRLVAYLEATSSLSIQKLEYAAKEAIRTLKFLPKPAELIELAAAMPVPRQPERVLIGEITPPEESKKRLAGIFDKLNKRFGTNLKTGG